MVVTMGSRRARIGKITGTGGRRPNEECGRMRVSMICQISLTICAFFSEQTMSRRRLSSVSLPLAPPPILPC